MLGRGCGGEVQLAPHNGAVGRGDAVHCTELGVPATATHDIAPMRSCPRLRDAINVAAVEGKFGDLD